MEIFVNNFQWFKDYDCCDYCNCCIEQILKYVCVWNKDELFDIYIEWVYCDVYVVFKVYGKGEYGNDYFILLDCWVFCFVKGFKLFFRFNGKKWDFYDERMLMKFVREECEIFSKQDEVFVDFYDEVRKVK